MAEQASLKDGIAVETVTVDPRALLLLEKNARFMKPEVFRRLVENVRRDGVLTSLPFCVREGEGLRVLSGNHRVLAAIEAGLVEVDVLVSLTPLSIARQRAIQLSHNSLTGEDDPVTLRELFGEIEDLDWREAFASIAPRLKGEVWLAPFALYDDTTNMLDTVSLACEVRAMGVTLAHLLDVFGRHLGELKPELEKGKGDFPLAVLFERAEVPRESARRVQRALSKVADDPWEALEKLVSPAADAAPKRSRTKPAGD